MIMRGTDSDGVDRSIRVNTSGNLVASTAPSQTSAVPSNFAIATGDATVFTLAAGERGFIQNIGTTVIAVKKGASASTTSFSMLLAAGSANSDGLGNFTLIDNWIGVVSVAAMTGTARYLAWKETV